MAIIRDIVDEYPCLAMDTEFPGVVARPVGNFKNSGEYHYQMLRRGAHQSATHLMMSTSTSSYSAASRRCQQAMRKPHRCRCRCNVDMLKLIQLGLTFTDAQGNLPTCNGELCVWQFNFK